MDTRVVENVEKHRGLGHHEQLFYTYNKGNNSELYVSINTIESKGGEITLRQVRDAFLKTSKMNFLMHACVKVDTDDKNKKLCFHPMAEKRLAREWVRIDEISLDDGREESWAEAIPRILKKEFDYENGPLWGAVWAKITDSSIRCSNTSNNKYLLFFVCSHMIIDGKSGLNLICNQIVPFLNGDEEQAKPIYFARSKEEIFYGHGNDDQQTELANQPTPFHVRLIGNILSWKSYACRWLWGNSKPCHIKHHYKKFLVQEKPSQDLVRICKSRGKSVHAVLMSLVYNALKDASVRFAIEPRKDIAFVVDETKFEARMSDPKSMPIGTYHHISKHEMRPVILENARELFKMVDEVMVTIKETNVPRVKSTTDDVKKGLLTSDLIDSSIPSNLGNGDAINTYDQEGSRDVVLRNHYFCVPESRFKLVVFVNSFRKQLHVVVGHNTVEENEPYCVSIAQKLEENIMNFVKIYG